MITILLMACLSVFGQRAKKEKNDSTENIVYTIVEKMAVFPGGNEKMIRYIQTHQQYPPKAKLEGRGGVSYITFIVEKDGSLSDIKVLKGASGGTDLDEEALRIVKSMPKWKPGKQNGKKVRVAYNLPVRFIGV